MDISHEVILLGLKALAIIALVYVGNKWLLPKLLHYIALTKNQELFMMSIFLICFSIALLTSSLGMSLAFGAFLAGLMISESEYSHNAFGNLIPFKDTFTSFFFVSIGMLLDLSFIIDNYMLVISSVLLVIAIKTIIAGGVGFILGHTFLGTVLVGLALAQVGEFSFVLAKIGFENEIISNYYYQLFLAVAVITMSLTPFLVKLARPIAKKILKLPLPKFIVEGIFPLKSIEIPELKNHLVIIGKDTSSLKLSRMAGYYNIKHASIIFDPVIAKEKMDKGDIVIYGDAVNEPILHAAHTESADLIVVSIGSLIPAMAIIETIKKINPNALIVARSKYIKNVEDLYRVGADQILPEKLEIALDLFNRILLKRLYSKKDINQMLFDSRKMLLGELTEKDPVKQPSIMDELSGINISAITVDKNSEADGISIKDLGLRKKAGVTILAIKRDNEIIQHPCPSTKLMGNDITYVIGDEEQINYANGVFMSEIDDSTHLLG